MQCFYIPWSRVPAQVPLESPCGLPENIRCMQCHFHAESCFHKDCRIQKELFRLFWPAFLPHTATVKQEVSLPLPFRAHTSPRKWHIDSIDKKLEKNRGVSRFVWIHYLSAHWRGYFQDTQSPFLCFMGRVRWWRSSTTMADKPQ